MSTFSAVHPSACPRMFCFRSHILLRCGDSKIGSQMLVERISFLLPPSNLRVVATTFKGSFYFYPCVMKSNTLPDIRTRELAFSHLFLSRQGQGSWEMIMCLKTEEKSTLSGDSHFHRPVALSCPLY